MSASDELSPVARHHVEKAVESLAEEYDGIHSHETIERVMDDSLRQLVGRAEVDDFVRRSRIASRVSG